MSNNLLALVRQRLTNRAKETDRPFQHQEADERLSECFHLADWR